MTRSTSLLRRGVPPALALALLLAARPARAQDADAPAHRWMFGTRVVLSGNSDQSEPEGFTVYSAVALEGALTRRLGRHLAAEFALRTESREVDRAATSGPDERLGSLELLPMTLALQYRLSGGGAIHPYAGVGATVTIAWEMSGALDSLDMPAHFGPAIQLGMDVDLGNTAVLNVNVGWNAFTADLTDSGDPYASLKIDPIAFGLGVRFAF